MHLCIPLLARVQSIEATVKDLNLCEVQNQCKITRSFIEIKHSYFAPNTKESLQEDDDFIDWKRVNEDDRELFSTKIFKNVLIQLSSAFPTEISKDKCDYC